MPNHVHLIVTPATTHGLARAIGEARRRYTAYINARERVTGHLFQACFNSVAMDEAHCLAALRYVAMNPVRANLITPTICLAMGQHANPPDWRGRRPGRSNPCPGAGCRTTPRSRRRRRTLHLLRPCEQAEVSVARCLAQEWGFGAWQTDVWAAPCRAAGIKTACRTGRSADKLRIRRKTARPT